MAVTRAKKKEQVEKLGEDLKSGSESGRALAESLLKTVPVP